MKKMVIIVIGMLIVQSTKLNAIEPTQLDSQRKIIFHNLKNLLRETDQFKNKFNRMNNPNNTDIFIEKIETLDKDNNPITILVNKNNKKITKCLYINKTSKIMYNLLEENLDNIWDNSHEIDILISNYENTPQNKNRTTAATSPTSDDAKKSESTNTDSPSTSHKKSKIKVYLAGGAAVTAACVGGLCYFYPEQTKTTAASLWDTIVNNSKYYWYKYLSDTPWKANLYQNLKLDF